MAFDDPAIVRNCLVNDTEAANLDWEIHDWETVRIRVQSMLFEVSTYRGFHMTLDVVGSQSYEGMQLLIKGKPLFADAEEFIARIKAATFKPENVAAAEMVLSIAKMLLRCFDDLERAIEWGNARVMARKGSVLAPFRQVFPDQWRYFRFPRRMRTSLSLKPATNYFRS